jgi:CrcB protein
MKLLMIALGGALGAILRYKLSSLNNEFPYGTFLVNISGSFFIGFFFFLFLKNGISVSEDVKSFIINGLLGALTTFSTFSLELAIFFELEDYQTLFLYLVLNIFLGFGAVILGKKLVEFLL